MKKIILFFFVALYSLLGQAQVFTEGFEGAPTTADGSGVWALTSGNWLVRDNRTQANPNWRSTTVVYPAYQGTNCAFIDRENTGQGVLAEEWLITPQITGIPANSQFRFFTRQTTTGDVGTKYQIRVSNSANQSDLTSFTVLKEYTETELSSLTADQLDYEEKIINLTFTGARYFAFVKVFTQPGAATSGDRWLVDNVRIIERCKDPQNLGPGTITSSSASPTWDAIPGVSNYEVIYGPAGFDPESPSNIPVPTSTNSVTLSPLTSGVNYQFYVRSVCPESTSIWVGPYLLPIPPQGTKCSDPKPITNLPYQDNSNTIIYGDNVSPTNDTPGTSCGTTGAYLASNDVVYSYQNTSTSTILLAISMNPQGSTNTGIFVYGTCNAIGTTCLGGVANANSSIRNLNIAVTSGQTIYVLLSSTTATASYPYTLIVQQANCVAPINLGVSSFNTTSATLTWANGAASTSDSWEVAVQPEGALIPSGAGVLAPTGSNTGFTVTSQLDGTPLTSATRYQYWVRADCGGGIFSAWSGPFFFNTDVCEAANKCNYTFVLSTSTGNGWKGAIMQIKQSGVVVGTVGPTFTTGLGPVNVTVPMCNALPFDLVWSTAGTNANSIRLLVKNSFDQPIYSITSNSGNLAGTTLLTKMVDCLNPECLPPTNLVAVPGVTSADLSWTDINIPQSSSYGLYVVTTGSPAPTNVPPTPPNVVPVTNPYTLTQIGGNPLLPSTSYTYYVKAYCDGGETGDWTIFTPVTFVTKSANDECAVAVPVPVNPSQACTLNVAGSTRGATASNPVSNPPLSGAGCGAANNDVWFSFVATSTSHTINLTDLQSTPATATLNHSVFSGDCNNLVRLYCSATLSSLATGLTVGNTYYIRVYNSNTTAGQFVNFNICITSPPVNDECANAISIPVNPGQICTTTVAGNTLGATASSPVLTPPLSGTGCGQGNFDIWYSFVATATSHSINISDLVGTPASATLNHSVFSGDCNNLVKMYCSTSLNSGATGLTIGNTYYIRVYNANTTAGQSVTFNICITSPPANDECLGAIDVPVNPDQVCNLQTAGNTLGATPSQPTLTGTGCTGSDDDVWFKFTATNAIHLIEIKDLFPTPTTATIALNHTLFSGDCGTLTNIYCSTLSQSVATGLTVGQTYYIRVYTNGTTAGQSATFNVCIKTPPPPATNDACADAIPIAVNLNSVCALTTPGNIIGATASTPAPTACQGNANDDVWFSFVATGTRHIISLLNVEGTTTNLNHAVYSGTCGALVQKYCSAANSLTSNDNTFVVGQTYYVRVWSNEATSQVTTFDICVKSVSTCENAAPFCGSSPTNPYIFENTTGIPSTGQIACLGSNPNPTYYTLHVGQTGPLFFNILQNTAIDSAGNPTGQNLDVDFVAWGPFTSTQACNQIAFSDCPTCPFDNFTPPADTFYPFGNIVDCSYSASFTETLSIPNAQQDEYYIILITNFNGAAGFIKLVQTNFTAPDAGETICCGVELGPNKSVCDTSVTLNALEGVIDLNNVPSTYEWFFNGSTTPIPGENGPTLTVNQSGTYKVTGACGLNPAEDTIEVTFNVTPTPEITITQPTCENLLGSIEVTAPVGTTTPLASNLYISEVTDEPNGSSSASLSYVEIYNGTGAAVDLSNYKLKVYTNGIATAQCDAALSGTIANNATVIAKLSTDANLFGITPQLTPLNCTGVNTNDSIVLTTSTDVVVDTWGINGTDFTPLNAAGYDYRRNTSAVVPSATWNASDWTVIDWTGTTTAADYSDVGSYSPAVVSAYQYNVDNGTWQSGTTFNGLSVGSHTIYVKDITTTCISSLTFEITSSNLNQPVTTCEYPAVVCISDPNPTNSFVGLTPNGQFSTNSAQLVIDPVTGEVNLAASQPGSYQITYTFAGDLPNCIGVGSTTVPIVVNALTVPSFTQIDPICFGTPAPSFANSSNNGITGSWNPSIINNTATATYTFTPDAGQCADVATMTIVVTPPTIVPDFTQIPSFCEGTPAPTLPLTSNNGITGIWNPATVSNTATATYAFTPDAGQCADVATMTIVVTPPNITPDFTQIPSFCEGTPAPSLPLTSNNGITGVWNPATVSNTASDTYSFTPDAGQCAVSVTMTIQVTPPNITPDFTQIPSFCEGTPAPTLPLTSNNGITGVWSPATVSNTASDTYAFTPDAGQCAVSVTMTIQVTPPNITPDFTQIPSFCEGTPAPTLPLTSNNGITGVWSPATVSNTVSDTYAFTPDAGQCAVSVTMTIQVTPPNIIPTFTQIADICSGSTAPSLPTTSNEGISGTWNPNTVDNNNTATYQFTPNAGQCALGQTMTITVNPTLTPDFPVIPPICEGSPIPTLDNISPNGIPGVWSPATITGSGTYTFSPAPNVCALAQTLEVTIVPKPVFTVTGGCIGTNYTLTVSPEIVGAAYVWKDENGNVIPGETTSTLVVTQVGSYTCEVAAGGCSDSQTEPVTTISCLIQKGISPKGTGIGDGKNDFFDLEGFNVSKLQIFNRYGAKVYSKTRYVNEWYGQSDNGDELPDGTYFYVIDIDGQKSKSGWIYINHEQ